MDNINIGFIGGCISKQPGIGKDRLYTSVLKNLLRSQNLVEINTCTASYLSYDHLAEKTRSLIALKKPNIICVFIRPFPLLPIHKLLIKYNKTNEKTGWAVHPNLFKRKMDWGSKLTETQSETPFVYTPKATLSLRDINIFMGIPLMLHKWAMSYLSKIFLEIQAACKKTGTQFLLISPPSSRGSIMGNFVCRRTTYYFQQFSIKNNIDYVNINTLPEGCFEKDKIHLNEEGHFRIANLLYDKLLPVYNNNHSIAGTTLK